MSNMNKVITGTIVSASALGAMGITASANEVTTSVTNTPTVVKDVKDTMQNETKEQIEEHKQLEATHADETNAAKDELATEQKDLPEKHANELNEFDKNAEKAIEDQKNVVPNKEKKNIKDIQDAQKQMNKNVTDKQSELDKDPARTAEEQRNRAKDEKTQADKSVNGVADKTIQGAKNKKAESDKSAKAKEAKSIKAAQDKQKSDDAKSKSVQKAGNTKAKATKDNDATLKANKAAKAAKDKQINALTKSIADKKKNKAIPATPLTGDQLAKGERVGKMFWSDGRVLPQSPKSTVLEPGQLPMTMAKPKLTAAQEKDNFNVLGYHYSNKDKTEVVKGKLTAKQQSQINAYATILVNSFLSQQGHSTFKTSKQAEEAMIKIMDWRVAKNLNFEHTEQDQLLELNKLVNGSGLGYHLENLGAGAGQDNEMMPEGKKNPITMLQLMTDVYNSVWNMVYSDNQPDNLWGHRDAFIRNANEGNLISTGIAKHNGDNGYGSYVIEFGFFHELKSAEQRSALYGPLQSDMDSSLTADVKQTYLNTKSTMDAFVGPANDTTKDEDKLATLKAESKALATKLSERQAKLTADYNAAIKANDAKAAKEIAAHKAVADKKIADARAMAKTELAANKAAADKAIAAAESKRQVGLAANKETFDKTSAAAVDETEEQRQARHEKALELFKAEEQAKLQALENKLNQELAALQMSEAKDMENLQKRLAVEREALVAKHADELKNFPEYAEAEMKKLAEKHAKELAEMEIRHAKELKTEEQGSNKTQQLKFVTKEKNSDPKPVQKTAKDYLNLRATNVVSEQESVYKSAELPNTGVESTNVLAVLAGVMGLIGTAFTVGKRKKG